MTLDTDIILVEAIIQAETNIFVLDVALHACSAVVEDDEAVDEAARDEVETNTISWKVPVGSLSNTHFIYSTHVTVLSRTHRIAINQVESDSFQSLRGVRVVVAMKSPCVKISGPSSVTDKFGFVQLHKAHDLVCGPGKARPFTPKCTTCDRTARDCH